MNDKAKILIFDDDTDILELCTVILNKKGYQVFTASSCEQLMDKVNAVQPDLIFMDNWIPDVGGIEATRQLKKCPETRHIPVIYFSANNDVHLLAAEAGANTYLAKPFDINDLEKIIADTLKACSA